MGKLSLLKEMHLCQTIFYGIKSLFTIAALQYRVLTIYPIMYFLQGRRDAFEFIYDQFKHQQLQPSVD
jgi:hypothetical protein